MFNFLQNCTLYQMLDMYRDIGAPVGELVSQGIDFYENTVNPLSATDFGKAFLANLDAITDLAMTYKKPSFGIAETRIGDKPVKITEQIIEQRPFCDLVHFAKQNGQEGKMGDKNQPRLLIFAPMSGHYASLLRGTVEGLLPHADVYITDWKNARDVPLSEGGFDFYDYIDYAVDFMKHLGKDAPLHVLAVCQPCVPVFAAVAHMSANSEKAVPKTLMMMGGSIDARKSSNHVTKFSEQNAEWFTNNLITIVPPKYPGAMRAVYPGYLQLLGFLSLNMPRHLESGAKLYRNIILGSEEDTDKIHRFYKEYFSVMDLTAEFYMQTIQLVFKDYSLPEGVMMYRGEYIAPEAIERTALFAIEGEQDDIAGIGQTKAALELCDNLPDSAKAYRLQKGVGHYGIFNGSRYKKEIVPTMLNFMKAHS